jgi:predicted phosphoribosyltransferase
LVEGVDDDPRYRDKVGVFKDRQDAGNLLAGKLSQYAGKSESALVVAVPSGGVPVGYVVAKQLGLALDVVLVRKIPIPWEPEAGFGSLTFDGSVFLNEPLVANLGITQSQIAKSINAAKKMLEERTGKFADATKRELLSRVAGKTILLVDDGLASGYSMLASVDSVRKRKPDSIIVAVPTASLTAVHLISPRVDKLIVLNLRTSPYFAVADAYAKWYDVPEDEALELYSKIWAHDD